MKRPWVCFRAIHRLVHFALIVAMFLFRMWRKLRVMVTHRLRQQSLHRVLARGSLLKKLPHHLAFVLPDDIFVDATATLVCWASAFRVPLVSIYDEQGAAFEDGRYIVDILRPVTGVVKEDKIDFLRRVNARIQDLFGKFRGHYSVKEYDVKEYDGKVREPRALVPFAIRLLFTLTCQVKYWPAPHMCGSCPGLMDEVIW